MSEQATEPSIHREGNVPKKMDEFPESSHPNSKYPWDEWLDGETRKFVQGEDYDCKTASFRSAAQMAANRRGGKIRAHLPDGTDGDTLVVQFVEEDPDA